MKLRLALLLLPCLALAVPSPIEITVDSAGSTAPTIQLYRSSPRTIRARFINGTPAEDLTGLTTNDLHMTIATGATAIAYIASDAAIYNATNGQADFTFTAGDLNIAPGTYLYEVAAGASIVRQGTALLSGSPYSTGTNAPAFVTNQNLAGYTFSNAPWLTDADSDGNTYGRKDGGWVAVTAGAASTTDLIARAWAQAASNLAAQASANNVLASNAIPSTAGFATTAQLGTASNALNAGILAVGLVASNAASPSLVGLSNGVTAVGLVASNALAGLPSLEALSNNVAAAVQLTDSRGMTNADVSISVAGKLRFKPQSTNAEWHLVSMGIGTNSDENKRDQALSYNYNGAYDYDAGAWSVTDSNLTWVHQGLEPDYGKLFEWNTDISAPAMHTNSPTIASYTVGGRPVDRIYGVTYNVTNGDSAEFRGPYQLTENDSYWNQRWRTHKLATPVNALDVFGTSASFPLSHFGGLGINGIDMVASGGAFGVGTFTDHPFVLGANNTEYARMTSNRVMFAKTIYGDGSGLTNLPGAGGGDSSTWSTNPATQTVNMGGYGVTNLMSAIIGPGSYFYNTAGNALTNQLNGSFVSGVSNWIYTPSLQGASIVGGASNIINNSSGGSIIAGGRNRTISAADAVSVGGLRGSSAGQYGGIIGGVSPTNSGTHSFAIGGDSLGVVGNYSFGAGGYISRASGQYSTVLPSDRANAAGIGSLAHGQRAYAGGKGAVTFSGFYTADGSGGAQWGGSAARSNIFLIRGDVGIGTTNPVASTDNLGSLTVEGVTRSGRTTNFMELTSTGLYAYGSATWWDDVIMPVTGAGGGSAAMAAWSSGIFALKFVGNSVDDSHWQLQIPHGVVPSGEVRVHMHISMDGTDADAATGTMVWSVGRINGGFTAARTNTWSYTPVGTAYVHKIVTSFTVTNEVGGSDLIVGTVTRDNNANDDGLFLHSMDAHIERWKLGSDDEYP